MTIKERFEAKFVPEPNSGCWLWTGAVSGSGYGMIWIGGHPRMEYAHRVAWQLYRGEIPEALHILHHCDVKLCVRPDHLFSGTNKDNMSDRDNKGRTLRGERHGSAKLRAEEVQQIRESTASQRAVAEQFGVHQATVWKIKHNVKWA